MTVSFIYLITKPLKQNLKFIKISIIFYLLALKKVITYFEDKKFQVKAIVPEYRVRRDKSSNHDLMKEMHDNGKLITTPSKSYDDLILLESAVKLDAAILSNDLFRKFSFYYSLCCTFDNFHININI